MGSKTWLLLKKKDAHATGANIAGDNRSVVSRRTLEDVAVSAEHDPPKQAKMDRMRREEAMEEGELADAPVAPMPRHVRPMLATLVKEPFDDEEWIFEVKWDGYRAIARIGDAKVSLYSRNLLSLDEKFAPIRDTLRKLTFEALLDGEIVVVDDEGYPDFQMLQDWRKLRKGHLIYYVFDLLHLGGHDLMNLPLIRRKELLRKVLPSFPGIRFTDHIWKDGVAFFNVVSEKGLEGIVAKNSKSIYRPGKRSLQWLKVKTRDTQDAVIGGFTEPGGLRKHFGALVLGVYEKDDLVYIGHTGGGFSAKTLAEIRGRLEPLIRRTCPFKIEPKTNRAVTWVEPELVCEVDFHGWTTDGVMRQPTFLRMRDDKSARDVMREKPLAGGGDRGKAP